MARHASSKHPLSKRKMNNNNASDHSITLSGFIDLGRTVFGALYFLFDRSVHLMSLKFCGKKYIS
jgi:hypothetical protein